MRLRNKLLSVAASALFITPTFAFANDTASTESAPASTGSPVAVFDSFKTSVANGQAGALWNHLPKSWQANLTEMTQMVGQKMPAATWDKSFSITNRLGKLLEGKSDIFAGMLAAQMGPDQNVEDINSSLKVVGKLFGVIGSSDFATVEKLKTIDLASTVNTTGSELLKMALNIKALNNQIAKDTGNKAKSLKEAMLSMKAEVVSQEGDSAKLKIISPDGKEDIQEVVKVEGKWMFKEMVDSYNAGAADFKAQLSTALDTMPENQMQVMMAMGMVETMLTSFEAADTPEKMQQAIQSVAPMLGGFLMPMSTGPSGVVAEPIVEEIEEE